MSRKRWIYTEGGRPLPEPIEVSEDWKDPGIAAPLRSEAEVYGNVTPATDGTPLDSRTKHRNYMKRNNLTMAEDFTGTWEKASKEREAFQRGESQSHRRELADDVGMAIYETRRNRR